MIQTMGIRRAMIVACALVLGGITAARADDKITAPHLEAARAMIAAIHVTDPFDGILPAAAEQLKATLIQNNPNLQDIIVKTVDDEAIKLAARRGALEDEVARNYAKAFSEDDLKAIAAFYTSSVGKKLLSDGPIVEREVGKAVQIWQNGITRDLAENVSAALDKATGGNGGSAQAPAPAPDQTPAKAPAKAPAKKQ